MDRLDDVVYLVRVRDILFYVRTARKLVRLRSNACVALVRLQHREQRVLLLREQRPGARQSFGRSRAAEMGADDEVRFLHVPDISTLPPRGASPHIPRPPIPRASSKVATRF